jgi:hypothetical protein
MQPPVVSGIRLQAIDPVQAPSPIAETSLRHSGLSSQVSATTAWRGSN